MTTALKISGFVRLIDELHFEPKNEFIGCLSKDFTLDCLPEEQDCQLANWILKPEK